MDRFNFGYNNYTTFETFYSIEGNLEGNKIFKFDGDVEIPFKVIKKGARLIFANKGNVSISIGEKAPKLLVFDNEGDVNIHIIRPIRFPIIFVNKGNISISGIYSTFSKFTKLAVLGNEGNVTVENFELSSNVRIETYGNMFLKKGCVISRKTIFRNIGSICCEDVKFLTPVTFSNTRNVHLKSENDTIYLEDVKFTNGGNVIIESKGALRGLNIDIKNKGNFYLRNISKLLLAKMRVSCRRNAVFRDVYHVCGQLYFSNGGDVNLNSVETIDAMMNIHINNGGDVSMKKLSFEKGNNSCPLIKCGGNIYVKYVNPVILDKRFSNSGYIIDETTSYYSNASFIKRNNIPVHDGKVILYKGVARGTGLAKYDECDDVWDLGNTMVVGEWNPYESELGCGKFAVSNTPLIFGKLLTCRNVRYYAVEVNITDIHQYPFPKYPQIVGVRKAKVLYMVDENKNKIDMEYRFMKDFYDFMESGSRKGEKAEIYVLNSVKTNKTYIDPADGLKKQNPFYGKLFKNQLVSFEYGKSYAEEMKKINPEWTPSESVAKYERVDGNPLLKRSVTTGKISLPVTDPTVENKVYFYEDDKGNLVEWDNVQFGDVNTYMPSYSNSSKDENTVVFRYFGVDSIYKVSSDGEEFVNDDFNDEGMNIDELSDSLN